MRAAEQGSATVWAVGVIAVLMSVTMSALQIGAAVVTRHRAAAAADLAALAGAAQAGSGEAEACRRARWTVERMAAHLMSCHLDGPYASVEITAELPEPLTMLGAVSARARAGPAELRPPSETISTRRAVSGSR